MRKAPWQLSLTNKKAGAVWRLPAEDSESAGLGWTVLGTHQQPAATLRLSQVQQVERHGNGWRMQGKVAGAAEPVALQPTVLTPNTLQLSVEASNLSG